MWFKSVKQILISAEQALPDRDQSVAIPASNMVLKNSMTEVPTDYVDIQFGMGCFWGAERRFWQQADVFSTAVGYAGGYTKNPLYKEVCSGDTAHTEVVKVVYKNEPAVLDRLLKVFWEAHDPTQGYQQGNDVGTQYRSSIYVSNDSQLTQVLASKAAYQASLSAAGLGEITTEIAKDKTFYFAEEYHQQYLEKNPAGYCGLSGTGVSC